MQAINPKYQAALDSYCENPYWKKAYEEAPEGAKKVMEGQFWFFDIFEKSDELTEDQIQNLADESNVNKDELTADDCRYLARYAGHPLERDMWVKLAKEKSEVA